MESGLVSAVISAHTDVRAGAFEACSGLVAVTFKEDSYEEEYDIVIGPSAFGGCYSLTSVILPKHSGGGSIIGKNAFADCESLRSLTIPKCLEIGSQALFIGHPDRKATITFTDPTPPYIYPDTFNEGLLEKIIVPKGSAEAYKTADNWTGFADFIEEAVE